MPACIFRRLLAADHCGLFHRLLHGTPDLDGLLWRGRHEAAAHAEESPKVITVPLMVLAALSILGGALNLPFEDSIISVIGSNTPWSKWNRLPLDLDRGGHFHRAGADCHFHLLAHLRAQSAQGGQPDPLKKPLGFIFTGMENKWFVDEGYWAVFVDRSWTSPTSWRM